MPIIEPRADWAFAENLPALSDKTEEFRNRVDNFTHNVLVHKDALELKLKFGNPIGLIDRHIQPITQEYQQLTTAYQDYFDKDETNRVKPVVRELVRASFRQKSEQSGAFLNADTHHRVIRILRTEYGPNNSPLFTAIYKRASMVASACLLHAAEKDNSAKYLSDQLIPTLLGDINQETSRPNSRLQNLINQQARIALEGYFEFSQKMRQEELIVGQEDTDIIINDMIPKNFDFALARIIQAKAYRGEPFVDGMDPHSKDFLVNINRSILSLLSRARNYEFTTAHLVWPADADKTLAKCRGLDPALFFPARGESTSQALATCAKCPIIEACGEYAIAGSQRIGIWGGTSEPQRRRIRRARLQKSEKNSSNLQIRIIAQTEPQTEHTDSLMTNSTELPVSVQVGLQN